MGNSNTFENLEVTYPSQPGEWIIQNQLSYCTLVRNTKTNCLAEQYQVLKNPKFSTIKNLETYQYRRRQNENIVKVYKAQEQPSSYLCHGRDHLKVKTQRIPFRLSQLGPLNLSEGLFILLNSLKGYKTIFDLNGASIVDDEMIGFTEEGKVKVWLSSNFAKNTPDSQVVFKPEDYLNNQKIMVSQIVDIVQDHLIIKQYPSNLFNLEQNTSHSTFLQTIQSIERYINIYRLSLPISITFRQQQKETSLSQIQSQINRGNSTIIQTKENSTIRQPLITCGGIFQTSTNNINVPLTSSQISNKPISQISSQSQKIQINNGSQTSRSSLNKQHIRTNSVVKQSTQFIQNPLNINYTPLTFRQLTNNLTQTPPIVSNVFQVNNAQMISFQSPKKTHQHQNFKSIQKPTTLYYSRSVDNLHSPCQNNPYVKNKNNIQPISNNSNVVQQKTSSQLIDTKQYTNNAWHSSGIKVGDYGSRNQISVIDSLGIGSKGRIQNIINKNTRYTSPSKIFYQNQISSTISETQPQKQNYFNNPKYTYLPKYNSLMTENTKQKQSSRIVFNSPPKNINIYQSNDYLKKSEVKKPQVQTKTSPSLTQSAYKSYMQKVESCVSSLKTNLFELKQLEVKNYLIGNSQISPMKSIDDQNYVNPFSNNITQSNSVVQNISQLKSNSNSSQIKTQLSQLQKQSVGTDEDVFDPNIFKQSKLSEISHPSLVKDLTPISYISTQKINEQKIGQSSNSQPVQIQQQQQIDQDEIKAMISKNLKFVQRIAISYVDQIQQKEESRTQLMVPSYSQFRQALLAANSLPNYQYRFQTMQ